MAEQVLVLLGDSILDNWPYTAPAPDTTAHLQQLLGPDWSVVRLAQDGSVISDVRAQMRALGERPALAVLSIGGNDALAHTGLLEPGRTSAIDLLEALLDIAGEFEAAYQRAAQAVKAAAGRTVLCTIYEVQLEPPADARRARVPLAVLNDRIIRVAARLGVEVLELRAVCTDPDDFVQQIEPSPQGAAKIARAIAAVAQGRTVPAAVHAPGS